MATAPLTWPVMASSIVASVTLDARCTSASNLRAWETLRAPCRATVYTYIVHYRVQNVKGFSASFTIVYKFSQIRLTHRYTTVYNSFMPSTRECTNIEEIRMQDEERGRMLTPAEVAEIWNERAREMGFPDTHYTRFSIRQRH